MKKNISDLAHESLPELQARLSTSAEGLKHEEAQRRLAQYGYNEIAEKKVNLLLKFLSYFWGPIPWMIEVAAALSAIVGDWNDFAIILSLLLVNTLVSFWEEYQAGNTIAALKAQLAIRARVKRDGEWTVVPSRELAPGDVIRLRLGDIVPADARLLEGDPVQVDQSALTGESLPVTHETADAVYSGSIIKQGEIDALVYGTGQDIYFGRTAHLVKEAHTVSHFQRAVLKIGDYLIVIALALVIIILTVALFRGDPILTTLQFALILTVAAIPVAMPTVLSVTMAVGARLLAKKKAIVSRLASIEEIAGMDELCSDKTGTLTQNKLTLGAPFTTEVAISDEVILSAALASRAEDQDPIDLAVLSGLREDRQRDTYLILHFQPFDPVHKRTEATVKESDGNVFKVTKGAPQVILELATNKSQVQPLVEKAVGDFAEHGFRSLGVARTDEKGQWQLLGIIPLYDPLREDSRSTIETARKMGVGVKMVTGDGVNDAPALKKADVGIAVSGATDAARSAADIVLLTPGLSVIIDAIKESRKIFQRMTSYVIYRIAETTRVLLFMTLSILVFNFYPVTAVMIVLLALLNDGAILSIAFDHVRYSQKPEVWDMPVVLGVATVLGIMGVFSSFGMFYLDENVFHFSREMIQTLMYLKLSVAGILTIFLTRTKRSFWFFRPAPVLVGAVLGIQLMATLIAVYGLFMAPIGWGWALFVWGYALVWFLVNDRVKMVAYRIFNARHPGLLVKKAAIQKAYE